MRREWRINRLSAQAIKIAKEKRLNPITIQLLLNRKVSLDRIDIFLNPQKRFLFSPFLLPDIHTAVSRIEKAIREKEKILLYGDYDVDGITSLTIFYEYLKEKTDKVSFYIPHRLKEGFGLNEEAIKKTKEQGSTLLICFDCGSNAYYEIELAKRYGIDTIVVDHHQPKRIPLSACAFINPKREDSNYPFPYLSSGAISFKLVQALSGNDCEELMDLVALSIVCDVVPLREENRILLKAGLENLKNSSRLSINALCEVSGVKKENIDTFHLGYILGPRINASGRMYTAYEALHMFLAEEYEEAKALAVKLNEYNQHRKNVEIEILKEAEAMLVKEKAKYDAFVLYNRGWHHGILGIVASRIVDKYYRPTLVIGFEGEKGRGSARSIESFNIIDGLKECEDLLITYGGHQKAAGIEIAYRDVEKFRDKFNEIVKNKVGGKDLIPFYDIDLEISFSDINEKLIEDIERLKPFGEGNPLPLFLTRGVTLKQAPKKVKENMYSVWLTQNNFTYEAIFYERNGFLDFFRFAPKLDIVYSLEKNYYYNSIRLILKDIRL